MKYNANKLLTIVCVITKLLLKYKKSKLKGN